MSTHDLGCAVLLIGVTLTGASYFIDDTDQAESARNTALFIAFIGLLCL
jgi:hypothetical protein